MTPGTPIVQDETAAIQDAPTAPITSAAPGTPVVQDETSSGIRTVLPGETLTGIAAGLGTSLEDLMAQNGITNPNLILSGQPLLY